MPHVSVLNKSHLTEASDQALQGEHSVHALEGTAWLHTMKRF